MEKYRFFIKELTSIISHENILLNEPMSKHTSFKIGGPVDIMILPQNIEEILEIIKLCKTNNINYFILGNGSNILVRDKGIRGLVIKIGKALQRNKIDNNIIECESGILLANLANIAYHNSLAGLEFASGIPGSLGGAVIMNAGAYGGEMKDIVIETTYIDEDIKIKKLTYEEHKFGYRDSFFQGKNKIILSVKLKLKHGDKQSIKVKMMDLNRRRKEKQPLEYPSAGSIFKRPQGYYVGKLIEDCGLRGYSVGDAQISKKHCGFIINSGAAKANEVLKLIEYIQEEIMIKYNVGLQTELKIIGEK